MSGLWVIALLVSATGLLVICVGGMILGRLEAIRTDQWLSKHRANDLYETATRLELAVGALSRRVSELDHRILEIDKSMVDNLGPIARQITQENVSNMIADGMKRGSQ